MIVRALGRTRATLIHGRKANDFVTGDARQCQPLHYFTVGLGRPRYCIVEGRGAVGGKALASYGTHAMVDERRRTVALDLQCSRGMYRPAPVHFAWSRDLYQSAAVTFTINEAKQLLAATAGSG